MEEHWYCARNGIISGPMPLSALQTLIADGELAASDLVWHEGYTQWVDARLIEDLFPRLDRSMIPPLLVQGTTGDEESGSEEGYLSAELRAKADHNYLQASFKLNECQAHLKVHGRRQEMQQLAHDGLEFIEAALVIDAKSSRYWNLKGLLLSDGLGEHEKGLECLRKALEFEPDSIVIKQNIRSLENQI